MTEIFYPFLFFSKCNHCLFLVLAREQTRTMLRNLFPKSSESLSGICKFISRRCLGSIRHESSDTGQPRICIIGSGPAGFYTAQFILKHHNEARVDIFEKMPVPFGLVRYGVAPDHPEVKNATNTFEETARNPRCRFFGNVNVGQDVKAEELREMYDGVVFAYGADDDKTLGIPGEKANGVQAARTFVGWYNGLPAHADLNPNLNCEKAVIIGQGNVALDVARMLLAPHKLLQNTDISAHALEAIKNSSIKHVHIIGRRGPLDVSFTIKELRELIRLEEIKSAFHSDDFVHIKPIIKDLPRQRRRLIDLMCTTALSPPKIDSYTKQWELDFFRSPVQILTDSSNNVSGIKLEKNRLMEKDDGSGTAAVGTGEFEELECGLVLRSIGYKSIHIEKGIPFDVKLGVIPNIGGRVVQEPSSKDIVKGLYCSGWVKHGPVGVIVTTMNQAFATAENIVEDMKNRSIGSSPGTDIQSLFSERGVNFVSFSDYENIDKEEMFRGQQYDKPREKIISTTEMLNVALKK